MAKPDKTKSNQQDSTEQAPNFTLLKYVGIFLAGLGVAFIGLGMFFLWQAHFATWNETEGEVTSVTVRATVNMAGDTVRRYVTYYPKISYRYVVDGETSNRAATAPIRNIPIAWSGMMRGRTQETSVTASR